MRPGLTTATQYSGAPLPLPIRVSAGFFVTGLSGNMRIQILPPRLMWRVIAMPAASIWRSVIHAGSKLLSPYSPKLISLPRVATPFMRPRICFRCLTFFGINMSLFHFLLPFSDCQTEIGNLLLFFSPRPSTFRCAFALASSARPAFAFTDARFIDRIRAGTTGHRCFWIHDFAAINPNLHSDLAKRRLCLSQTIIDICAQSVQRQLSLKMPFATRDFSTIQSTTDLDFNPLRAKPQRLFDGFSHRPTKSNTLLELGRNLLSLQLCIQFRLVNLLNRHEHFTPGLRREVTLELVDFGAFPTNDDAWSGRVDDYLETIGSSLDINVRNASACKTLLQVTFQLEVFQQKLAELLLC